MVVAPEENRSVGPELREDHRGRNQAFQADVAHGKAMIGGVVVFLQAHRLARVVNQKVMDQMATAQQRDFVADKGGYGCRMNGYEVYL
jgi:hypothetical protein